MDPITSLTNERIKRLVKLRNRRERDRSAEFLIEGYREVSRAVAAGIEITELYISPELYLGHNEPALTGRAKEAGAAVIAVAEGPFRKASYRDRPEGLLAVARQFDTSLEVIPEHPEVLLLVVEGIEKPGNLGTMLRTAEAAGAHGVIVCDPTTDPFNPNVVRASVGTLFQVPLAIASTDDTIAELRRRKVRTFAATPDGSIAHFDANLRGPSALVIGSEQLGLTEAWLEGADQRVLIPMPGAVDSLNAAMSAGVLLFEAVRQRFG